MALASKGTPKAFLLLPALVLLSGCPGDEESQLQFGLYGNEDALRPLLTISAIAGDWSVEVAGSEIGTSENEHLTRIFDTPESGRLDITVQLAEPGQPPIATLSTALEIRRDWIWGVNVHLSEQNPTELCFGCFGHTVVAVPDEITPGIADSLYVVWGGNSISEPVVY